MIQFLWQSSAVESHLTKPSSEMF